MLNKKKLQEDMKKLQADLDKVTEAISKSVMGSVRIKESCLLTRHFALFVFRPTKPR
jgi:hypothetical protein